MNIFSVLCALSIGLLGAAEAHAQVACRQQLDEVLKIFDGYTPLTNETYLVMHKDRTFSSLKDWDRVLASPRTAIVPMARFVQENRDKAYQQCRSNYMKSKHNSLYDKAEKDLNDLRLKCDIHLNPSCKEKALPLIAQMQKSGISEHCKPQDRTGVTGGQIYLVNPYQVQISGSVFRPQLNLNRVLELKMSLSSCEFIVDGRDDQENSGRRSQHYFRNYRDAFMYMHRCDQGNDISYDDKKICEVLETL